MVSSFGSKVPLLDALGKYCQCYLWAEAVGIYEFYAICLKDHVDVAHRKPWNSFDIFFFTIKVAGTLNCERGTFWRQVKARFHSGSGTKLISGGEEWLVLGDVCIYIYIWDVSFRGLVSLSLVLVSSLGQDVVILALGPVLT